MAKTLYFWISFVLMKGVYEIVQANNNYLHKVDTMSLHLIIIRPFAQFWIVNMTSLHSCSEGYAQKLGQNVPIGHLTLLLWLLFSCVCTK